MRVFGRSRHGRLGPPGDEGEASGLTTEPGAVTARRRGLEAEEGLVAKVRRRGEAGMGRWVERMAEHRAETDADSDRPTTGRARSMPLGDPDRRASERAAVSQDNDNCRLLPAQQDADCQRSVG